MRYQRDLQAALDERFRRLLDIGDGTYAYEVRLVADWIEAQPPLRALLQELALAESPSTVADWVEECESRRGLYWPTSTEGGRARLIWDWMRGIDANDDVVMDFGYEILSAQNADVVAHELTRMVIAPLVAYLRERIGAESSVLYLLERYVRRLEWFERDSLHARYEANTQHGEKVYDDDLRRFLFDQGLNMPFSQTKSASGLSDVLGEIDSDDPLVCEVKLFDAASHDRRAVVSGVQQVVQYAQDYSKRSAFLVIINLSGRPLEVPTDGAPKTWPRYVEVAGVRVHFVIIRALPPVSASKLGKLGKPVTLTRDDLIGPDAS